MATVNEKTVSKDELFKMPDENEEAEAASSKPAAKKTRKKK
jgi:hypothetical protein